TQERPVDITVELSPLWAWTLSVGSCKDPKHPRINIQGGLCDRAASIRLQPLFITIDDPQSPPMCLFARRIA
ncbi:MAG: hypothetical protein P8Z79_25945, partial [Sedimentisphaerales bacterium]